MTLKKPLHSGSIFKLKILRSGLENTRLPTLIETKLNLAALHDDYYFCFKLNHFKTVFTESALGPLQPRSRDASYMSPFHVIYFEACHWPSDHMIS